MRERLIELRKNILNMSQREFCEKLGLKQTTYAPVETGKREIRDAYILLICQVYNINEDWLRNGKGEVFNKEPDRELEELLILYSGLPQKLKALLLRQARELRDLQSDMKDK